jgi:hypothetical protein
MCVDGFVIGWMGDCALGDGMYCVGWMMGNSTVGCWGGQFLVGW